MNSPTLIKSFKPYVHKAEAYKNLFDISLKMILKKVTAHKLVLLRGFNSIERDELLEYCESQADLLSWNFGPVMEMKVDKQPINYLFTEGDVPLHWDGAFHQEPRFLFFNCIQAPTPGAGGETLFVNTESVWDAATAEQQDLWRRYSLYFKTEKLAHYGGSITRHLVNQHPNTKNTILRFAEPVGEDYLNPVEVGIVGKTSPESDRILKELSHAIRLKEHLYQHQWQEGDFLIADNFSLLHGRNAFNTHCPRHLRRIQIL